MESPVALILILAALSFADQVHSQTIYATENPIPVGSNVTLVSNFSVTTGGWIFNSQHIVLTLAGYVKIAKAWIDRVTYDKNTSSLTITSLKLEDSGVYSLEEIDVFTSQLTLRVEEPVSNVTVQAKAANLVEFNDTAVLVCSVSKGTPLSFAWLNGSSVITANGRVQLSNGNTTLTIMNVTRCDHGPYSCQVFNDVSNEISPSVNLTISYGPSNPKMMIMPQISIYKGGSNITLTCSAESSPPPVIQWMVDGVYLNQTGSMLQLQEAYERNSGNYTCLLHNTVTFRFASATAAIQIVDPVTAMVVSHAPAILGEKFSLLCEVTGTADIIIWWRNDHLISADNEATFSMDNKTLTLNPVLLSHGGNYQCQAFNSVSNMISDSYTVTVNYGPEMISVMGPSLAKAGDNVTFSCNATSTPSSLYMWYFNDVLVSTEFEYVTPALTSNMSGQYICVAFNSITGKNISVSKQLDVVDPIQNVKVDTQMLSAKEGHSYNLTCSTNAPADYIYWMKNEQPLNESSTVVFHMHNQTVNFNPVERSHDGNYQCMAINMVSKMLSAPYTLLVNYGPETPIIEGPAFAQTGHQAVFSCSAVSVPPSQFYWWFNGSIVANTSVYTTDLLSPNMSGKYTCRAINDVTGKNTTTSVTFTVIDPVTAMVVSHAPAILGETFSLLCEVTGTADIIIWWRNGHLISADNEATFSMDNKTLTLNPVLLSHGGNYQCQAFNSVSNMTSDSYTVTVNYGPEMISVMGPSLAKAGDNVTFSCNATSTPPSLYMWYFNDVLVSTESEYVTPPLTSNMSGQYICMAFNSITGKNISASKQLDVVDPIKNVTVAAPVMPAIEGSPYSLTCSVTGSADHIYWMKDGERLHEDNRTVSYMNKTVYFGPVERYDTGNYQCMAVNAVGNMTSPPYKLIVNYGPETPIIYGPAFAEKGRQAVFNCSAVSEPPSQFCWWFNGSIVASTSVYTTTSLSFNMSGNYTCMAMNDVTGKNSTNSTMLTVIEAIESVNIKNNTIPIDNANFDLTCEVIGPMTRSTG
ncbi:carcinoembryonic antigen-related cell adhesion molecule 5-like [Archocentrus centrarchus]|uniref:carcinoembryonic antigen-related cell adhesion molecule 5-like n=1 Tax=Archocentrus centrarchus TaxID=63155 RepID=UPI0011E9DE5C|nr:carcinoembryonic antigen-related cell adhesion molecule 5-like [Archocentrus centrarchus]